MKKMLLLLCTLFTISGAYAKDYLPYYTYINKAEGFLVNNQVDSCYYYYDKAFSEYDFVFVRDAFIAAEVSFKHQDITHTLRYLTKGAANGLTPDCLSLCYIFDDLKTATIYPKVRMAMDSANEVFLKTHNKTLFEDWHQRFVAERDAAANGTSNERIQVIDDNANAVMQTMKTTGFPGEQLLGPTDNCQDMNNIYSLISLIHYDCCIAEMFDQLWDAVKKGELHPKDFAALCESELEKERLYKNYIKKGIIPDGAYPVTNDKCYVKMKPRGLYFALGFYKGNDHALSEAATNREKYDVCNIEIDDKMRTLEQKEGYLFHFGRWPL